MSRRSAFGLALVFLAALLGFAAVRRVPAGIPTTVPFMERDATLDAWVAGSAPLFWTVAILAGLGATLLPVFPARVHPRSGRIAALLLAAAVTADAAYVSSSRMDRIPHVFDEFNYLFQARNFVLGQMGAAVPPFVEHFNQLFFVIHNGRWYGSSLPGHPLVLAIGVALGAAWLVNPVMGGLCLLLLHRFLERLVGPGRALLGVILLAVSPFFRILASVYLAHTTSLFCALVFLHAFTLLIETGERRNALAASLAFGLGLLARPQAILVWTVPLGVWAALRLARGTTALRGRLLATALVLGLPLVPLVAFDLAYDKVLTGEWTNTPRAIVSPSHRLGFGPDVGKPVDGGHSGHTPRQGIDNVRLNVRLLGRDLFGWWGGSLLLVPLSLLALRRGVTEARTCAMVLVSLGALAINSAIYFAYFTPSPLYGPRYYYEMLPALVLLTLEGGRALVALLPAPERAGQGLLAGLGALCLASLGVYDRAHLDRYQPDKATALRRVLPTLAAGRAIVLLPPPYFTTRAQSWNDHSLQNEVIFGADLGDRKNRALLASMPDRKAYRFRYDRGSDAGRLGAYDEDTPRVLVVGIDSATWTVMEPMMARGELPNFARLRSEGSWARLSTLTPTLSPAIWTSIATGVQPERHGITGFVGGDDPEHELQITSDQRHAAALWDMCASRGVRADVLNYWCTWPAEPIDGVMVSDRARLAGVADRVHPRRLLPLVEGFLGLDRGAQAGEGLKASQHFGMDEDKLLALTLEILDREPAPLSIVYFRNLDIVQHRNWSYHEPAGFDVSPEEVKRNGDVIPATYRHYDEMLGKLRAAMPPGARILVLSDHGMESAAKEPPTKVFQMNRLLEKLGLLVYARFPIPDKERTRAFSSATKLGEKAIVYVSSDGAVRPVEEALRAVTLDGAALFTTVEVTGKRLTLGLSEAVKGQTGTLTLQAGPGEDLVVLPRVPLSDFVKDRILKVTGQHENAPPGVLLMAGPGIRAGVEIQASVLDVAPTVLALLGLPPAADIDGHLLEFALDPSLLDRTKGERAMPYRRAPAAPKAALPKSREEEILEELRSLDYLR